MTKPTFQDDETYGVVIIALGNTIQNLSIASMVVLPVVRYTLGTKLIGHTETPNILNSLCL